MIKKIISIILSVMMITVVPVVATNIKTVNVLDYGAVANDNGDDTSAIQSALDEISSCDALVVNIPEGTFNITGILSIYSNTTLVLTSNTNIVCSTYIGYMLRGRHNHGDRPCYGSTYTDNAGVSHTCDIGGYNQLSNITISGGNWYQTTDAYTTYVTGIFKFTHCNNITIKDLNVYNASNHFFNLSASNNMTISNVGFYNQVSYLGSSADFWGTYTLGDTTRYRSMEAIHLDAANETGESSTYPFDNTHCSNITVTNCTFDHVHGGLGNHHVYGFKGSNITVTNNRFTNLAGYAVSMYSFDNINVSSNTCDNAYMFLRARSATNATVSSNTVSNSTYTGLQVRGDSASDPFVGTVTNNTISSSAKYDLEVWDNTVNSTITDNALTIGIHVSSNNVSNCNIANNGISLDTVNLSLSYSTTTYNGQYKTPAINGLDSSYLSTNYSNNKKVGTATVTVNGAGLYYGSKTFTFKIKPVKTTIKKLSKGSRSFTVRWTKKKTQVTGYQIQYSRNKSFTNAKKVTVKSYKTTYKKISKLAKKKTYYVRVRTYKTVNGVKYYSTYSSAKKIKTK